MKIGQRFSPWAQTRQLSTVPASGQFCRHPRNPAAGGENPVAGDANPAVRGANPTVAFPNPMARGANPAVTFPPPIVGGASPTVASSPPMIGFAPPTAGFRPFFAKNPHFSPKTPVPAIHQCRFSRFLGQNRPFHRRHRFWTKPAKPTVKQKQTTNTD